MLLTTVTRLSVGADASNTRNDSETRAAHNAMPELRVELTPRRAHRNYAVIFWKCTSEITVRSNAVTFFTGFMGAPPCEPLAYLSELRVQIRQPRVDGESGSKTRRASINSRN